MTKRIRKIISILLIATIMCGCSSATNDFTGIAMGEHHVRNANLGYSPAQVMASEHGVFVEEMPEGSQRAKEIWGGNDKVSALMYEDSNIAGLKGKIVYAFFNNELIMALVSIDTLYPENLYSQLCDYYTAQLSDPIDTDVSTLIDGKASGKVWQVDNVIFGVILSQGKQVLLIVADEKYN